MHQDAFTEYETAQKHQLSSILLATAACVLLATSAAMLAYWAEIAATLTVMPAAAISSLTGVGGAYCLRQTVFEAKAASDAYQPHMLPLARAVDFEMEEQKAQALDALQSSPSLASHIQLTPTILSASSLSESKEPHFPPAYSTERTSTPGQQR